MIGLGRLDHVGVDAQVLVEDKWLRTEDGVDAGDDVGQMVHLVRVPRHPLRHGIIREVAQAHIALEANPLLASGWAVVRAPGGSSKITLSSKCVADQREIISILNEGTAMPLTPKSSFPTFESTWHIITFQDASTSTGAGGWALINAHLHGIRVEWPQWVIDAFAQNLWSISPAELWIIRVVLRIVGERANQRTPFYITSFTDNESARAAANKFTSNAPAMHVIAHDIGLWFNRIAGVSASVSMRTMRVTTKENATADAASRFGGEDALQQLALELGVPLTMHTIAHDDSLWELIAQALP